MTPDLPRCRHCGAPACCHVANPVDGPRYHCARCCWQSWLDDALPAHLAAEGIGLPRRSP